MTTETMADTPTADAVNKLIDAAVEADTRAAMARAEVVRISHGLSRAPMDEALTAMRTARVDRDDAWDTAIAAAYAYGDAIRHDGPPSTKRATPCGTGTLPAQRADHEPPP